MTLHQALVAVILVVTYAGVAIGRLPWLRLDRAGLALVGATAMMACGALSMQEAFKAVDLGALALLLGMMIIVAELEATGFFRWAARLAARFSANAFVLLALLIGVTGLFSAFLVNDAICLVMAPLVLRVTRALGLPSRPFLLAVALSSNAGSVATITGNPQNVIIGAASQIPYGRFAAALAPTAALSLLLVFALTALIFRTDLRRPEAKSPDFGPVHANKALAGKAILVALGVVAAFFLGAPAPLAALAGASLLLTTRAIKPQKIYRHVDGGLLLMFAGLFIVAAAAEKTFLTADVLQRAASLHLDNVWALTGITAVLSNLVSNVPAVLALKPFIPALAQPQQAWLVVAMASTLAGNLTLLGSVANLIVAELARKAGEPLTFGDFLKVGAPVTLLSLAIGAYALS